jgi:hypothetical protein
MTGPKPPLEAAAWSLARLIARSLRKAAADAGRWVQCRRVPAVCLLLAAITFAVFGRTLACDFVNFDDNNCVYEPTDTPTIGIL